MKLRTEFAQMMDYHSCRFVEGETEDFEHDAMAAHALMRALEEAYEAAKEQPSTKQQIWITQYQTLKDIRDRADELLAEWTHQPYLPSGRVSQT